MLPSRHIVVADMPDGTTATVYQGPSAVEADKAKEKCVEESKATDVVVYHNPIPSQTRRPLEEKRLAEERATEAARALASDANRLKAEAQQKRETAKKLTAEAKRLETEAAKHLDTDSEK